jgi:hypothetical protein
MRYTRRDVASDLGTAQRDRPKLNEETARAEARGLVAFISALSDGAVDEGSLRHGVWTYVGARRSAGASPGEVIMELIDVVDRANHFPMSMREALTRSVTRWCVEAHFGHLGSDVVREADALSDSATRAVK